MGIYLDTARKQAKPFSCWGSVDLICLLEGEIYRCEPSPPESDIGSPREGGGVQSGRGVKNRVQTKWQRGPLSSGNPEPPPVPTLLEGNKILTCPLFTQLDLVLVCMLQDLRSLQTQQIQFWTRASGLKCCSTFTNSWPLIAVFNISWCAD